MKYNIIYADPPWKFNNKNTGGNLSSGSANQYDVLSIDDICKIPVQQITADDAFLFLWWVGAMPQEALNVVNAWGFVLKTMKGFTWVKKTKKWLDWFGMGFWTRQGTEDCLLAIKGKPERVSASIRQVVNVYDFNESIEANVERHSIKPPIFRERIVELCGDISRIELFARESNPNWDVWGKEVKSDIDLTIP